MKDEPSLFPNPKGRPSRYGKRVPIGFRVTPRLKQMLDMECKRTGRSQSEEIEIALIRHLQEYH